MKVLFMTGIGVSFGEIYTAVQIARQIRLSGHDVEFACVCNETALINQISDAGFKVISNLEVPPLMTQVVTKGDNIKWPKNFTEKLMSLFAGPHELIYLIDYHHFFMRPELFPVLKPFFTALQETISKTSKRVWTNDNALWALDPYPDPKLCQMFCPPPSSLEKLFLPSPLHFQRYKTCREKHQPVFFYQNFLDNFPQPKPAGDPLNFLLTFSHFAIPIADRIQVASVETIVAQALKGLGSLPGNIQLTVTGVSPKRLEKLALPQNVTLNPSIKMNLASFDAYDQELVEYDGIILFNTISLTIIRALFMQIPVLLLTHNLEAAGENRTLPFNLYPSYLEGLELIYKNNPYFHHCCRCDVFDDQAIADSLCNKMNKKAATFPKELYDYFSRLPVLADFF